jgi:hypothetical protein
MISSSSRNVTATPQQTAPRDPAPAQAAPPPDQEGQRGDEQEDGPGVGQYVLLEDQLQRVEEHRDGGYRRQPSPGPEPDQHRIHERGRGQSHQVLGQRDDPQVVQQQHRDDQDGVAALPQRVHAPAPVGEIMRVLQVPDAVREDQGRVVGREHDRPQHGREQEQRREQPVPA